MSQIRALDSNKKRPASAEESSATSTPSFFNNDKLVIKFAALSCILIGIVTMAWVLYVARPVILPVVAAFIIGLIVAPIGERIQKLGLPTSIANLVILANILAACSLGYVLLSPKLELFLSGLPEQVQKLATHMDRILQPLERLQSAITNAMPGGGEKGAAPVSLDVKSLAMFTVSAISPAITQILIFLFSLAMFLVDRPLIKRAIVMTFTARESRLEALKFVNQVEDSLSQYLSTVFAINVGVWIATTAVLFVVGMPGYIAIGVAAFLLNFLPFVGPLFLKGALLVLGLAAFPTLFEGLLPVIGYSTIVIVESNLVTPILVGRKFAMRPLAVFLSIVFWTWLWGIAGALLAMPILVIASTIIDRFTSDEKLSLPG